MNKCKGCGKWWREDDRRLLVPGNAAAAVAAAAVRKCRSSGKTMAGCCTKVPASLCSRCNVGGGRT